MAKFLSNLSKIFKFPGGVEPATHKDLSFQKTQTIQNFHEISNKIFDFLVEIGDANNDRKAAEIIVKVGDKVFAGQMIAKPTNSLAVAAHSPVDGVIKEIANKPSTHPSGLKNLCVVISPDENQNQNQNQNQNKNKNNVDSSDLFDYQNKTLPEIDKFIQNAGIVGLGGAGFPTHSKIDGAAKSHIETIIINAAECEPYATSDDILIQQKAAEIIAGIQILAEMLSPKNIIIGIEDNKPQAIKALQEQIKAQNKGNEILIKVVPTIYPSGSAKQLAYLLTGKKIAASSRTTSVGVQVFNIATIFSLYQAIKFNKPLISRIVTITGNVKNPGNYEVLIGTPIKEIIDFAEPLENSNGIIHGGPMMGFPIINENSAVLKTTNCLIVASEKLFPPKLPEMPCIRCTACAKVCPSQLQPYAMAWFSKSKDFQKAEQYDLFECIECGCCSYVCPANIPLVHYFRFAKSEIFAKRAEQKAAEIAKERFEFKQFREQREKAEKAERLRLAAEKAAQKMKEAEQAEQAEK